MLASLPIPLQPIMLLWLNLATDGAPALALGMEKGDPDIMKRPPRPPREPVINRNMVISIIVIAAVDTIAVLSLFALALSRFPGNVTAAQTMAFTTLVCSELLRAYTSRSEQESLLSIGIFSNRWMVLATVSSFALLLLMLYVPLLQPFVDTVSLSLTDWLVMIPFMCAASIAAEITKVYIRSRAARLTSTAI
jgi:Ca2+-transporting ATPase